MRDWPFYLLMLAICFLVLVFTAAMVLQALYVFDLVPHPFFTPSH